MLRGLKTKGYQYQSHYLRWFSAQVLSKPLEEHDGTRADSEWLDAKPYHQIPGPSKTSLILNFLSGGKFYKSSSLVEYLQTMRDTYGPLVRVKGMFKRPDQVLTFDPEMFRKILHAEGQWPIRPGVDTFAYFRKNVRPDIFKNKGGLISDQGKSWADLRTLANPLLMKPANVLYYVPQVDMISSEFVKRIKEIRDPNSLEVPGNFKNEINKWSLESIAAISMNSRLGLLDPRIGSERGEKLIEAVLQFFQLAYELDMELSIWRYYKTKKFKRLMDVYNTIAETSLECINETKERLRKNPDSNDQSILAQMLKKDEHSAIIIVMDLLIGGVDTTTSTLINCLFMLAKHPEKQEILRKEAMKALPHKDSKITKEALKNLPYLRSCIKETLRIASVAAALTRTTVEDIVLNGYQIPKGTFMIMGSHIVTNDNKYIQSSDKFLPERWLRNDENGIEACQWAKPKHPFTYIPFGFGVRMCVGKRFAQLELELLLLRILRNFQVEWKYADLKYKSTMIYTPVGEMKFTFKNM